MKELDKFSLYVNGKVMRNILLEEVKINNTFKSLRMWSVKTLYYIGMNMMTPKWKKHGLLCCKDIEIVHCLKDWTVTNEIGL